MSDEGASPADVLFARKVRAAVGLLGAPFVGVFFAVLALILYWSVTSPEYFSDWTWRTPLYVLAWVFGLGLFGLPIAAFAGLPLHLLLQHFKLRNVFVYVAFGGLLGPSAAALIQLFSVVENGLLVAGIFAGAFGALFFWLIRRPDCDVPKGRA